MLSRVLLPANHFPDLQLEKAPSLKGRGFFVRENGFVLILLIFMV